MSKRERALQVGKVWYFLFFGGLAFLDPFFNLYLSRLGYSAGQIGILGTARQWISVLVSGAWCAFADAHACHRAVFAALHAASLALTAALLLVHGPFPLLAAVVVAIAAARCAVPALADAVVVSATHDHHEYGQCRLWGAVGWGAVSAAAGWWLQVVGFRGLIATHLLCELPGVYLVLLQLDFSFLSAPLQASATGGAEHGATVDKKLASVLEVELPSVRGGDAVGALPVGDEAINEDAELLEDVRRQAKAPPRGSMWTTVRVLAAPDVLLVLSNAALMGFGMGTVSSYLFLYLDKLDAPSTLMGLGVTSTAVAEVPVFHFSGAIVDRLGIGGAMHVVLAAFVVRLLAYATMSRWPTLWLQLPVELLHGITFGLAWAVGSIWAKERAPPGCQATMTGAFQSSYFGLGFGLGALVSGGIYQRMGPPVCFATTAVVIAAGWACTSASQFAMARLRAR